MNAENLLASVAAIASVIVVLVGVRALPLSLMIPLLPSGSEDTRQTRVAAIDGLRAFLALGVVFLHAWAFRDTYFAGRPFDLPRNPFFCECGLMAVLLFFMITGFLFWNKALDARGRLSPFRLYSNRARRILPLYYFLCVCALAVVVVRAGGAFNEPFGVWSREVAGLIVPGLRSAGPLLGSERKVLIAQSWTLYYEDLFYLALPLFGMAARSRRSAGALVLVVFLLLVVKRVLLHRYDYFSLSFLAGISTAELLALRPGARRILCLKWLGGPILVAPCLLPWVTGGAVTPLSFVCAAASFAAIAAGNDLFGLLTLRSVRVVGTLSYSIYLLHMLILFCGLALLNRTLLIAPLGSAAFSAIVACAVMIIVALSMLTYRYIEKPWMRARP